MSLPPVEIPLGAMRFNSDSSKLEYWNGSAWFQIHTFSPNLDGGTRAFIVGGQLAPNEAITNRIEFITIETQGNATDFGDLTTTLDLRVRVLHQELVDFKLVDIHITHIQLII